MKINLKIILVIALIPPVLFASLFILMPLYNNYCLHRFSNQIYAYDLADNTQIIEKYDQCGKLNGNGNNMDFFASMLIYSEENLDEIKTYYSSIELKTARSDKQLPSAPPDIEVYKVTSPYLECEYLNTPIKYYSLVNEDTYENMYFVVIFDGGYSADFDYRGH